MSAFVPSVFPQAPQAIPANFPQSNVAAGQLPPNTGQYVVRQIRDRTCPDRVNYLLERKMPFNQQNCTNKCIYRQASGNTPTGRRLPATCASPPGTNLSRYYGQNIPPGYAVATLPLIQKLNSQGRLRTYPKLIGNYQGYEPIINRNIVNTGNEGKRTPDGSLPGSPVRTIPPPPSNYNSPGYSTPIQQPSTPTPQVPATILVQQPLNRPGGSGSPNALITTARYAQQQPSSDPFADLERDFPVTTAGRRSATPIAAGTLINAGRQSATPMDLTQPTSMNTGNDYDGYNDDDNYDWDYDYDGDNYDDYNGGMEMDMGTTYDNQYDDSYSNASNSYSNYSQNAYGRDW
jgi:hypothetical protein